MFSWMLALAVIATGVAYIREAEAAPKRPIRPTDELFNKLDANGDKRLTEREFVGEKTGVAKDKAKKLFKTLDKDSDKSVYIRKFKKL
jgi:Ca2+-binding EF-hand superfamily protein